MGGELEVIVRELVDLSKRKPLPPQGLDRVKVLLGELRGMGYTNREVAELAQGGWSETTIKLYTRGATVSNPDPKEKATTLLTQLVTQGLTLNDVNVSISMKRTLDAHGTTLEDMSVILGETARLTVNITDFLKDYKSLKERGVSVDQIAATRNYRDELEKAGYTLENLKTLYQT